MNTAIYQAVVISCLSTFALTLGGCGGGGGGTAVVTTVKVPAVQSPDGISLDATYTASGDTVTSVTDPALSKTGSSISVRYNNDGTVNQLAIVTPYSTVTWDEASGDIIDSTSAVVVASDLVGSKIGVGINPTNLPVPWEYQTFGIWETDRGTGSGTVGAVTYGTPTTGSVIPKTGAATFTGIAGGIYVDAAGVDYMTAAPVVANVNFFNRSVKLETANTQKTNSVTGDITLAKNLNMTGNLTYLPAVNSFTGTVNATGLTGSSTGQFYGPNAEELGGVYSLKGAGVETYAGAYGAKQ